MATTSLKLRERPVHIFVCVLLSECPVGSVREVGPHE